MNTIKYIHHNTEVSVQPHLKGRHWEHCLCGSCKFFMAGHKDNCKIAQENFDLCVKHNIVTPVWECPKYEATIPIKIELDTSLPDGAFRF